MDGTDVEDVHFQDIERRLLAAGVTSEDVVTLWGAAATRVNILSNLLQLLMARPQEPLLIILLGQSVHVPIDGAGHQTVFACTGFDPSNPRFTGLPLSDLVGVLQRSSPSAILAMMEGPWRKASPERPRVPDAKRLLAIPAANIAVMAGGPNEGESTTTRLVPSTIDMLTEPGKWSRADAHDLLSSQRPAAEIYTRGSGEFRLRSRGAPPPTAPRANPAATVPRVTVRDHLHDLLRENRLPIWLWGESGLGKTTIVHMLSATRRGIYVSLSSVAVLGEANDEVSIQELIASRIADQTVDAFPSGRPSAGGLLPSLRQVLTIRDRPFLAIDHLERLADDAVGNLYGALRQVPELPLILISQLPPPAALNVEPVRCPSLTMTEVAAFAATFGGGGTRSPSQLQLASAGNARRLRALLASSTDSDEGADPSDRGRAIRAVLAAGGYLDETLFSRVTNTSTAALRELVAEGFLSASHDLVVPHDSLLALKDQVDAQDLADLSVRYWEEQVEVLPGSLPCARLLILTSIEYGIALGSREAARHAIETLSRAHEWSLLKRLARHVGGSFSSLPDAATLLAEELVHTADQDAVKRLVELLSLRADLPTELLDRLLLVEAERMWWYGDYERVIELCDQILLEGNKPAAVRAGARLHGAIAHWFSGRWDTAASLLERAETEAEFSDVRTRGWTGLMKATVEGHRGRRVHESKARFEAAILLLDQIGDHIGVSVAWGNYGEMSWKLGDFEVGRAQLEQALVLSEALGHRQQSLEVLRNLVQVALRVDGADSSRTQELKTAATELFDSAMGPTVKMQLWNTLATVAAFEGDLASLENFLANLGPLTRGNLEYEIYRLGNLALYHALKREPTESQEAAEHAAALAREAGNHLALREVIDNLVRLADSSLAAASETARIVLDQSAELRRDPGD